ncbi:related to O-methyltransferase B [Cephalotrichum gorgonifer]|uniref:Related to O-methyltransferase B n=1 Tax=Cephalotrichum gorgonifer TaxID=2041049 RepID=A0AAE8N970_9PEZI|nr:related to O-methyltransferase B [Cephalotrichum gorgonifer]
MPADVSAALAEAKALVASLEAYDGSAAQHLTLLKQTDRVRSALEEPYDIGIRWLENMSAAAALYVLIHIGAFEKITAGDGVTAAELAKASNVDVSIITRTMRILVANGIAVETGNDTYASNVLSDVFQPPALGSFVCVCVDFMRTWGAIPQYAKAHEPADLYDIKKSPFAFAAGHEGKTYYDVISLDPKQRNLWNITLQNMEKNFPIIDMFPFPSLKDQVEKEPERPFIVDVGGGRGQALLAIKEHCGGTFGGKLILQDLPIVIDSLKPEDIPDIEPMTYDIFTPQPVKNAHVYLMRRLLHDFYNPVCVSILSNTASAMGPDSRLLICDMLVPERVEVGGAVDLYWLDFSLLTISGKERTMEEFKDITDQAGLEIVAVHPSGLGRTIMVETRLKRE